MYIYPLPPQPAIVIVAENTSVTYLNEGLNKYQQGDYQGALIQFNQALRVNPRDAQVYYNRAVVYYDLQKYHLALEDINRVIVITPEDISAYYLRGLILSQSLLELDRSIADFTQVIKLDSRFAPAYFQRANLYYQQRELDNAFKDYTNVINLAPEYPHAYYNRALVRYQMGDRNGALQDLEQASQLYFNQGEQAYYEQATRAIAALATSR